MQPSFVPIGECLYNWSLDEAKPGGDSLTLQGPVDFGTAQDTVGIACPACSLFSRNSDDSFAGFSFTLSVTHETNVIIPGKSIYLSNSFP